MATSADSTGILADVAATAAPLHRRRIPSPGDDLFATTLRQVNYSPNRLEQVAPSPDKSPTALRDEGKDRGETDNPGLDELDDSSTQQPPTQQVSESHQQSDTAADQGERGAAVKQQSAAVGNRQSEPSGQPPLDGTSDQLTVARQQSSEGKVDNGLSNPARENVGDKSSIASKAVNRQSDASKDELNRTSAEFAKHDLQTVDRSTLTNQATLDSEDASVSAKPFAADSAARQSPLAIDGSETELAVEGGTQEHAVAGNGANSEAVIPDDRAVQVAINRRSVAVKRRSSTEGGRAIDGVKRQNSPSSDAETLTQSLVDEVASEFALLINSDRTADVRITADVSSANSSDSNPQHAVTAPGSQSSSASNGNRVAVPASVGETVSLSAAEATRFVGRVTRAFEMAQQRGEALQIRLSPPELGSLRIEIAVRHGALTASMETDTTAARNALLDNLPVLRERLAEQQIRIDRFEVDVRDQSRGQSFEQHSDSSQRDVARHANGTRSARPPQSELEATNVQQSHVVIHDAQLNLIV